MFYFFFAVSILLPNTTKRSYRYSVTKFVTMVMARTRYSFQPTSGAVSFARNSGAHVIAITDSPVSPIAAQASQALYAKSDMASFADSLAAPLSLINALVVAVSRKKQNELTVRLRQLERIWEEYNVYDTNQG